MRTFFRFICKNKDYTFISIFGLAISLAFVIIVFSYCYEILSIDKFQKEKDNIYLLLERADYKSEKMKDLHSCIDNTHSLRTNVPDIEEVCIISNNFQKVKYGEKEFLEQIMYTDSSFFDFFTFELLAGDPMNVLNSKDKCVITKDMADKLFKGDNPIGKSLEIARSLFTVSGVCENLKNTVIPNAVSIILYKHNALLGYSEIQYVEGVTEIYTTGMGRYKTFIKVNNLESFSSKEKEILGRYSLKPLRSLYFDPECQDLGMEAGSKKFLLTLISIGLVILFFAVTNYINLSIALTGFRAKETASRRLLGAGRMNVMIRLILESTAIIFVSFIIALFIAYISQDYVSLLIGKKVDIMATLSLETSLISIAFIVVLGLITGMIPSYYLSKYKPIDIVKGNLKFRSKMYLSKLFIGFQNAITVVLMVVSITVYLQIKALTSAPLGYDYNNVCEFSGVSNSQIVKDELLKLPCIDGVALSDGTLSGSSKSYSGLMAEGKEIWYRPIKVEKSFLELYGMNILRDNNVASTKKTVYLTERAMAEFGIGIDEKLLPYVEGETLIGGVIKDFKTESVLQEPKAWLIEIANDTDSRSLSKINVKYNGNRADAKKAISAVVEKFEKDMHDYNESFTFLNDSLRWGISDELRVVKIVVIFTLIAILLSILGMTAISTYLITQRKKEVALRKIMGSTDSEILKYLLWKFAIPVLLSIILATPIAYLIASYWLENYSYRIALNPLIFIAAGIFSIMICLLTVFWKSFKASRSNPVNGIKEN